MKKVEYIVLGVYGFAFLSGIVVGKTLAKTQYHKGKRDAYGEMSNDLVSLIDNANESLAKEGEA